ncbi:hypothetical protein JRO89_XS05G0046200 [Xanthoceras sorbifolium]|uniref:Origin of replication complex subunit 6 n=1 Tax=Xanthoceras sorbifolium TaxID=99658 RepID=A0ABQ8I0H8_9ROSI|nr:hypothetical protein JRO89_XS05G0046200 [Xanthoceras sorbifolium]
MDLSDIAKKLRLSESKQLVRKAAEFRRLCDVQFDSSVIGVGEVCKAIICLEIAATRFDVIFDRQAAIKLSGMSEKAYNRSFNSLQNSIGFKYKDRFLASLPASRRASADFSRPIFTAVAFYLCAKKHKLKIDKLKLIEVCGTSESEFSKVSTSMKDLCHDIYGIAKEKKDPKEIKGNRELLDVLPEKRKFEDGGYLSDDGTESKVASDDVVGLDCIEVSSKAKLTISSHKRHKKMEKVAYKEWKSSVLSSNKTKAKAPCKRTTQTRLNFEKEVPETQKLEAV